jgi:hypothetical protein
VTAVAVVVDAVVVDAAAVDAAAVDAAAVDAASFRGCLQVVDSGKIAAAVAAVARYGQT